MVLKRRVLALSLGNTVMLGATAIAERRPIRQDSWPRQSIRIVVPFAAGGSTDVAARIMAERLGQTFSQPVVVENRSGSAGLIGAEAVAKAASDGYTLLMATTGLLSIAPHLYAHMPFVPARDFAPVSLAFATDLVITTANNLPATSLRDFLAYAKKHPGEISYASSGAGTTTHVATELFRLTTGIDIVHVPYRGSGPAMNDLVAGNVQLMVDQIASSIGQIKDGRIRALAVTGNRRHPLLPEVPTVSELGFPNAQATSWGGIVAPRQTTDAVIVILNTAIRSALADSAVQQRMAGAGVDPAVSSPSEFLQFIASENKKWGGVVRDANIPVL